MAYKKKPRKTMVYNQKYGYPKLEIIRWSQADIDKLKEKIKLLENAKKKSIIQNNQ